MEGKWIVGSHPLNPWYTWLYGRTHVWKCPFCDEFFQPIKQFESDGVCCHTCFIRLANGSESDPDRLKMERMIEAADPIKHDGMGEWHD